MKIQIIDDEQIHNFITTRLLRQVDPELELYDFNDPEEAFTVLPFLAPDLVFLDLNMPKINGWQFLDKMAEKGLREKVIILTSSVSNYDHTKALEYSNVVECVEKPVKRDKLALLISQNTPSAYTSPVTE